MIDKWIIFSTEVSFPVKSDVALCICAGLQCLVLAPRNLTFAKTFGFFEGPGFVLTPQSGPKQEDNMHPVMATRVPVVLASMDPVQCTSHNGSFWTLYWP